MDGFLATLVRVRFMGRFNLHYANGHMSQRGSGSRWVRGLW